MSYSKRERGQYIRSRMHFYILIDLGRGAINWMQAGYAYDLISYMDVAGGTHNKVLAANEYYQRAVEDWKNAQEKIRQRFIRQRST